MQNSMIAKLLAKENISVEHGNYRTAFFDVEKRVLGLPMWKDMGKDVYDLLVGHEVGHALETPADGWHDSVKEIPGCPRSYINIVEDIRIEKLIQRRYPGLVGSFKRGYGELNDRDFFGIKDKNLDALHIADRINLKAKLRDLIEVEFQPDEADLIAQVFAVETWDDVLNACRALYNFVEAKKEEQDNEKAEEVAIESDIQGSDQDGASDGEGEPDVADSDSDEPRDLSTDETNGSARSQGEAEQKDEVENTETESTAPAKGAGRDYSEAPHEVETDDSFRERETDLLDLDSQGRMKDVIKGITRKQAENMIITYGQLLDMRRRSSTFADSWTRKQDSNQDPALESFKSDTKKFVSLMSKEFEMRKMAYRYNRSQTSRSGSLDMNKLHAYKTSDDIFNRVTQLADAKSHGMIMFIDYSGSMGGVLHDVTKQTLILAEFCKKVNIPFDVYTFTTGSATPDMATEEGQIDIDRTQIVQILSSSMKKNEYNQAFDDIFKISASRYYSRASDADGMGGTPLNEVIMASRFIIRDFKAKYGIQKTNVVFMTDGDAQGMYFKRRGGDFVSSGTVINVDGNMVNTRISRAITEDLFNIIRKECTLIGYFIAGSTYDFRGKVWQVEDSFVTDAKLKELRKAYNANKFISYDNKIGYDKFFIIKGEGNSLNTDDDEFEVAEDANKGQIQRAFKNYANSKKANKILATQFAQIIA